MPFYQDIRTFFGAFLKNRKETGSVTGSSRFLARKMVDHASFSSARSIVELGPGLGSITKEILRRMHSDATLFAFEVNTDFCRTLANRFQDSRFRLYNASADSVSRYISVKADYVLSGIPLANLSVHETASLLNEVEKILAPGGVFVQFQYSLLSYTRLKEHFKHISLRFTLLNIPSAFVYVCQRCRE